MVDALFSGEIEGAKIEMGPNAAVYARQLHLLLSSVHTLTFSKAVDAAVLTLDAEIGRDDVARTLRALCIEAAPSQSSFAMDGMARTHTFRV